MSRNLYCSDQVEVSWNMIIAVNVEGEYPTWSLQISPPRVENLNRRCIVCSGTLRLWEVKPLLERSLVSQYFDTCIEIGMLTKAPILRTSSRW